PQINSLSLHDALPICRPKLPLDHYLEHRLFYDCAGWAGPDHAAAWGAHWVAFGLQEVALSRTVFATDYPQAVRDADEVVGCKDRDRKSTRLNSSHLVI